MNALVVRVVPVVLAVLLFALTDPIAQDPAYFLFADNIALFSVPNFWNVLSNVPFAFVGAWGLNRVWRTSQQRSFPLRHAYAVFFIGIFLTAFGSSYFHWNPSNATLFWDRLPMTIAFAGLFAIVIGEYVSPADGKRWLPIFLSIGMGSVIYWLWSEGHGAGDLRPYAIVQFLPMLLIPAMLLMIKRPVVIGRYIWIMVGFYVIAKLLEHFDTQVFAAIGLMSGHSLKHFATAVGVAFFAYGVGLQLRTSSGDGK